jgi:hypothetical protein
VLWDEIADNVASAARIAGLDSAQRSALEAAVRSAGDVPARPQHGDLWWRNLVMDDGLLWALDFDTYGEVRVPLYDALTLICSTLDLRAGGKGDGVERLLSESDEARGCRAILREQAGADGIHPSQLDGLLVNYLVQVAIDVQRRGGHTFSAPYKATLRRIAERLASGEHGLLARLGNASSANTGQSSV